MVKPAMQKANVLIISDEPETAKIWGFSLNQAGLDVRLIDIHENYMDICEREYPDLIIIEDFNDEVEELEICLELRRSTVVPILYLTTKTGEKFQLEVYDAGADECILHPITPKLFQFKVNAWLRRTRNLPLRSLEEIEAGGFTLDPDLRQVVLPSGEVVKLTLLETRLLYVLMGHQGDAMHKEELVQKVWGQFTSIDSRLLKNHVYRLRRKIEPDPAQPRFLLNVGYSGYKFLPGNNQNQS